MTQRLTPGTILVLTAAPLLWAGNAVTGRLVADLVPPMTLNFLRWLLALVLLLPLAWTVLRRETGIWREWRFLLLLGFLGIGVYNALQYQALHTSSPLNVTLVASSMPLWMMLIGALCFQTPVTRHQVIGAVLSMLGVVCVLSRGQWELLTSLRLVPGDLLMVLATISWSFYSWLLLKKPLPDTLRSHWAGPLMSQLVYGLGWSAVFAAVEWGVGPEPAQITWNATLVLGLAYIAIGPALIAYRCWGIGVQRVGPSIGSFFSNLTPLFAALMSTVLWGETPQLYHIVAFALIVAGIVMSTRR